MNATIKRVKDGRWFVNVPTQEVTAVFEPNEHDEALALAYKEGADTFIVKYTNLMSRSYGREFVKTNILKLND